MAARGAGHTDAMLSHLEGNGVMWVPMDLFDIDRRLKWGDESGWRGDPTMCLCLNQNTVPPRYEVWAIDRHGQHYMAASHHECTVELVRKVREGDLTRNDPFQAVIEHNRKMLAEQQQREADARREKHDRLAHAIRQDFGHLMGGVRRLWHISKEPTNAD